MPSNRSHAARALVGTAWAVLACSAPDRGRPSPPQTSSKAGGCPSARQVRLAFVARDDEPAPENRPRARWKLPLHFDQDAKLGDSEASGKIVAIDATAARAAGLALPGAPPWVLVEGQPPCRATLDGYYAEEGVVGGVTHGVWLAGCAGPPAYVDKAIAVDATDPSGCAFVRPATKVAYRDGTRVDDHWQRPARETPLPPEFARMVPSASCTPPACETLWTLDVLSAHGRPVAWHGAVTWLQVGPPGTYEEECAWERETFAGLFVAGRDGAIRVLEKLEGTDEDMVTHTIELVGALVDERGARVLVTEHPGAYTTYEVGPSGPIPGHEVEWMKPHPESMAFSFANLGPVCSAL